MTLEEISRRAGGGRDTLTALAECVERARHEPLINIWGNVAELTASHIRIAGLSKFTKLGDWVSIETELGGEVAEAIRIESELILVRPFEDAHRAAIGARAKITQALTLCPDESGKAGSSMLSPGPSTAARPLSEVRVLCCSTARPRPRFIASG